MVVRVGGKIELEQIKSKSNIIRENRGFGRYAPFPAITRQPQPLLRIYISLLGPAAHYLLSTHYPELWQGT